MTTLEVCVDSLESAKTAVDAGANRIELCQALHVGGITPPATLIQSVRNAINVPLIVLVRTRPGDFVYDDIEREQMILHATEAIQLGANGIAIGGLNIDNALDVLFLENVANRCNGCELVMHRAFDEVVEPLIAMETLIHLGFKRILTSGGPGSAPDNVVRIAEWIRWSNGRIQIMPGGGVTDANLAFILERTQCSEIHGSFRQNVNDESNSQPPDPDAIRRACRILNSFPTHG